MSQVESGLARLSQVESEFVVFETELSNKVRKHKLDNERSYHFTLRKSLQFILSFDVASFNVLHWMF